MFKIAHLSDLHAGYSAYRKVNAQGINLREADGYIALSAIITSVIEEQVDCVVIAGDTFHSPSPSIRTIIFVQNQLRRLWQAGIPVYALAGNHDTNDISIDIAASRVVHDPWRNIFSHIEPYYKHEIFPGVFLHMVSHHMYDLQHDTMSKIKPVNNAINIFTTHGSVIDPLLQEKLHTEQSPREIVIPDFLLKDYDWDYVMLGHIHERGWVGSKDKKTDTSKTKIFYNGSVLRRGFSDKKSPLERGWTLWCLGTDGKFTATTKNVAQRPQFDFSPIDSENLSSTEITSKIIDNLVKTATNDGEFDHKTAPILRQTLVNITPAKYASLDLKTIHYHSRHALDWRVKTSYLSESLKNNSDIDKDLNYDNTDLLSVYDEWAKGSTIFDNIEDKKKEVVMASARDFVKLGQEAVLDEE